MISVVITVDNEVIGLSETLYFALHALLRADVEFEVIVSCGISEDWSETFARHWIHEHQGIVQGQVIGHEWQGLAHALNLGWRQARGDLVLFAEAGVNWGEDHVFDLLALQSEHPTAHLLSAAWKEVDINDDEVIHTFGIGSDERGRMPCFFAAQATGSPIARISTVAVPRWALEHIDGFPEGMKSNEDAATIAFAKLAL
jgi:glycosyltransferase involved in cell wall biosynthesis